MRSRVRPVGDLKVSCVQAECLDLDEDLCWALDGRLGRVRGEGEARKVFAVGEGVLLHDAVNREEDRGDVPYQEERNLIYMKKVAMGNTR